MIVSVTEILKVVSSHMQRHLAVKNKDGATMHDFYSVHGQDQVLYEVKKYFEETIKINQFNVVNSDLTNLRSAYKERFLDSTITQNQLDGAESVWDWIAEQFNDLKSENERLENHSHHDDNTISNLSELIKEQQNKLRLFVEAVQKLEDWNKKYPPGKVYDYGQTGTIETLLQECVKMIVVSKEAVAHGDLHPYDAVEFGDFLKDNNWRSSGKGLKWYREKIYKTTGELYHFFKTGGK